MFYPALFFLIGLAQTVYLLLHGHLVFYTFYPIGAFASLLAFTTPVFYTAHTSVLLLTHSLPLVTSVHFKDAHTNGITASMRLTYEDCWKPRVLVQSAAPLAWSVAGPSLQFENVTQFAEFRVVIFCENKRTPATSDVAFFDEFTLNYLKEDTRAVDAKNDHRIQALTDPVPAENPWYAYTYRQRDRLLPVMWAILLSRLVADYHKIRSGKI